MTHMGPGLCVQELVEELGVYFVSFDRAGYGESDPNPGRTVGSGAMDIQDLADQLGLGSRFYVIGVSMGGLHAWGCIKYIPHRQSIGSRSLVCLFFASLPLLSSI